MFVIDEETNIQRLLDVLLLVTLKSINVGIIHIHAVQCRVEHICTMHAAQVRTISIFI